MAKKGQNAEMWVDNRKVLRFTIDNPLTPGTPLDLNGLTVKYAVTQLDPDSGDFLTTPTLIEKATGGAGIAVVGPTTDGVVDVTIDAADVPQGFTPGDYHHELEVFDLTPEGIVVTEGTLTINPNVQNTL